MMYGSASLLAAITSWTQGVVGVGDAGDRVARTDFVDQAAEGQDVQLLTNLQDVRIGQVVFPDDRLVGDAELSGDGADGVALLDACTCAWRVARQARSASLDCHSRRRRPSAPGAQATRGVEARIRGNLRLASGRRSDLVPRGWLASNAWNAHLLRRRGTPLARTTQTGGQMQEWSSQDSEPSVTGPRRSM